jgi:hypothetical protein
MHWVDAELPGGIERDDHACSQRRLHRPLEGRTFVHLTRHYAPTTAPSTAQKNPRGRKPEGEILNPKICVKACSRRIEPMNVEDLVGIRVWMKRDQFRSVSGIISSVPNAVNLDDLPNSIMESIFRIDMPSGDTIQVPGSQISKFDYQSSVCKKVPVLCDDEDDQTVKEAVQTSSPDELLEVA